MGKNIQIQEKIVNDLEKNLINEQNDLSFYSNFRNKNYENMIKDTKILKWLGLIFGCSLFIFPFIEGSHILSDIFTIIKFSAGLYLSVPIIDYVFSKNDFKRNNKKSLEASKMINILNKRLEEEQEKLNMLKSNEIVNGKFAITSLNKVKEFILLAKKYSESSERYHALFHNDLEKRYFERESEESMIMQGFILDDIQREKELEEEIKDVKVLSKVNK